MFKRGDMVIVTLGQSGFGWGSQMDHMPDKPRRVVSPTKVTSTGTYCVMVDDGTGNEWAFYNTDLIPASLPVEQFFYEGDAWSIDKMTKAQLMVCIRKLERGEEDWQASKIVSLKRVLEEKRAK